MYRKKVLIVEDNRSDAQMIVNILRDMGVSTYALVSDGYEALEFISGRVADSFIPDLIILDLNMIKMTGHEFLRNLRKDKSWNGVPVVVFTTSSDQDEVNMMLTLLQAHAYIVKPGDYKKFQESVQIMIKYHLDVTESSEKPSVFRIKTKPLN